MTRAGGKAVIKVFDPVMGPWKKDARKFQVGDLRPSYAQYDLAVHISWWEPRKRTGESITVHGTSSDDDRPQRFAVIEVDGQIVYDSRSDVPVDMDRWHELNDRYKGENRPMKMYHVTAVGQEVRDAAEVEAEGWPIP
ncbi:MAG TPA: hypothetical protein VME67_19485 [Mycobacterium sp.]|nr:hypothetical protein [Mycobacterium sp.]HTX96840.1 hypothetical protein [Mycobacterium sp.]